MSSPSDPLSEVDVLAPWGPPGPPPAASWNPDPLGAGFECRPIELLPDDEGDAVATLVRHLPDSDPVYRAGSTPWLALPRGDRPQEAAILYLHGRNDYFFNAELAREMSASGLAFYALDLRKHGRSLRPGQTIGWTDDLAVYDEEIGEAKRIIQVEHPDLPLLLMGHSTGGLIALRWAYRHPGALRGLILNSAWLEMQTMASMRPAMQQVLGRLATKRPRATVISSRSDAYVRSISGGWAGSDLELPPRLAEYADDPAVTGWSIAAEWKRLESYPVTAGWLQAVMAAQEEVEHHVKVDCPVLSCTSTASSGDADISAEAFSTDIVLDADIITVRSAKISDLVTIVRLPGKHDLALSDPEVRQAYYDRIRQWLGAFVSASGEPLALT